MTFNLTDHSGCYVDNRPCRVQGKTNEEAEEPVRERDDDGLDQEGDGGRGEKWVGSG